MNAIGKRAPAGWRLPRLTHNPLSSVPLCKPPRYPAAEISGAPIPLLQLAPPRVGRSRQFQPSPDVTRWLSKRPVGQRSSRISRTNSDTLLPRPPARRSSVARNSSLVRTVSVALMYCIVIRFGTTWEFDVLASAFSTCPAGTGYAISHETEPCVRFPP